MRIDRILRMISWLEMLPLQTAQDVIHFLYPESRGWRFTLGHDCDGDEDIFQYFTWSTAAYPDSSLNSRNSVLIAFQPPWILSEQDIREFSGCRSVRTAVFCIYLKWSDIFTKFPPFRKSGNAFPITLESKERLWAKVSF